MFCPNCGTQVDDHLNFCPKCGKPLHSSSSQQTPPQQQAAAQQTPPQQQTASQQTPPQHQTPPNAYQHYNSYGVPPTARHTGPFNFQRVRMDMLILSIASIMIILGSFLPWATASAFGFSASFNGMTGYGGDYAGIGLIFLIPGALDLVFALLSFSKPSRKIGFKVTILVLSIIMFFIASFFIVGMNAQDSYGVGQIGAGLVLIEIGSLIGIVMGILSIIHSVKK